MEIITTTLLLVALTFPILYLFRSYKERKVFANMINLLPGPPSYPIFGTALDMILAERKGKLKLLPRIINF